jgi:hypothetical protein
MTHLFVFTGGIVMGIYLEQKYNLPKITKTMDEIAEYLKKNEK